MQIIRLMPDACRESWSFLQVEYQLTVVHTRKYLVISQGRLTVNKGDGNAGRNEKPDKRVEVDRVFVRPTSVLGVDERPVPDAFRRNTHQ